jgi:hypothetical protein
LSNKNISANPEKELLSKTAARTPVTYRSPKLYVEITRGHWLTNIKQLKLGICWISDIIYDKEWENRKPFMTTV